MVAFEVFYEACCVHVIPEWELKKLQSMRGINMVTSVLLYTVPQNFTYSSYKLYV